MAKLAQSAPPDAISVYNEHVAVISEIKRSQWQITNYVILLFAGMLALRADIRAAIPADLRSWVAIFGPLVIWFSAAWILFQQHLGLTRRRQRIFDARNFLSETAQEVYGERGPKPTPFNDLQVLIACLGVTGAAAALTWLLLR